MNSSGKVTGKKEGAVKITASEEGVSGDIQASSIVSIWTKLSDVGAVTKGAVTGRKGASADASGSGTIASGTKVTIIGQCGSYYYVKLASGSLTFVEKNMLKIPVTRIELNKEEITISAGNTYQLTAAVSPASASDQTVKWSSRNDSVAKVDTTGKGEKAGL